MGTETISKPPVESGGIPDGWQKHVIRVLPKVGGGTAPYMQSLFIPTYQHRDGDRITLEFVLSPDAGGKRRTETTWGETLADAERRMRTSLISKLARADTDRQARSVDPDTIIRAHDAELIRPYFRQGTGVTVTHADVTD